MTEQITSRNNPGIKKIVRLLSSSKERRTNGLFVVEGLRLCYDAVISGYEPLEVYYTQAAYNKNQSEIDEIICKCGNVFVTDTQVFSKISDTASPQGILCVMKMPNKTYTINPDGKYIALCNIADPGNLGAVSRTAEALGIDAMLVSGGCDIYNPKALRASMGALLRINVMDMNDGDMFETLNNANIDTYASTPRKDAVPLYECTFNSGCAVLIGNEANGLTDDEISRCSHAVTIPMAGRAESLNAAAAASIIMYEMTRGVSAGGAAT